MKETKEVFYRKEIAAVKKDDYIACTLAQLKKRDSYTHEALFHKVNSCMPQEISKKIFEARLEKMTKLGLAYETFSNRGFRIMLSPVGSVVGLAISDQNPHLQAVH